MPRIKFSNVLGTNLSIKTVSVLVKEQKHATMFKETTTTKAKIQLCYFEHDGEKCNNVNKTHEDMKTQHYRLLF